MKKQFFYAVSAFLVLGLGVGCKHDDHDHSDDKEPPTVSIFQPSQSKQYQRGDTVWMDFEVKDNEDVHEVKWYLIRRDADTVYSNKRHQHAKTIRVQNTYYVLPESTPLPSFFDFSVIAEDDNSNVTEKTIGFEVRE
jgi:hypothetical protein